MIKKCLKSNFRKIYLFSEEEEVEEEEEEEEGGIALRSSLSDSKATEI